jgi:hypothetical protein
MVYAHKYWCPLALVPTRAARACPHTHTVRGGRPTPVGSVVPGAVVQTSTTALPNPPADAHHPPTPPTSGRFHPPTHPSTVRRSAALAAGRVGFFRCVLSNGRQPWHRRRRSAVHGIERVATSMAPRAASTVGATRRAVLRTRLTRGRSDCRAPGRAIDDPGRRVSSACGHHGERYNFGGGLM